MSEIDPEMTIGAVALAVLRRHFSAMLAKEPGTRLGDDIEELHDMRVANRRLRAALALFADVLPEVALKTSEELAGSARYWARFATSTSRSSSSTPWLDASRGERTRARS